MKKHFLLGALAFALAFGSLLTGCSENILEDDITYTVEADGASGTATTTKLTFTFSGGVSGLSAEQIALAGAAKGALTGSGAVWELALSSVTSEGSSVVAISKSGIESAAKTVILYKKAAVTYTVTPDGEAGTAATTKLVFSFSEAVEGLSAADITVIGAEKGELVGAQSSYELGVTPYNAGTAVVVVSKAGVDGSFHSAALYTLEAAAGYTVRADGSPGVKTTCLIFTFDKDVDLTIDAVSVGEELTKGESLSGGGRVWYAPVTFTAGEGESFEAEVSIVSGAVDAGTRTVVIYNPPPEAPADYTVYADGSLAAGSSARLYFTFDKPVTLMLSNVTVSGPYAVARGNSGLAGSGVSYNIPVTFTVSPAATLVFHATVTIAAAGITDAAKDVVIYNKRPAEYTVKADGKVVNTTSTKLVFTFDQDISGLTADDIDLSGPADSVTKGELTAVQEILTPTELGGHVWELGIISNANTTITATINKAGCVVDTPHQVSIYKYAPSVQSSAFDSEEGDNAITITLTGGTFIAEPELEHFWISEEGSGGYVNLIGGTVERVSATEVKIIRLTPVSDAGRGQMLAVLEGAMATKASAVEVTSYYRIVESVETDAFNSFVGDNVIYVTLTGTDFVKTPAIEDFSLSDDGTGGFISLSGGTVTRIAAKQVVISGLTTVTTAGSGQKVIVAAAAQVDQGLGGSVNVGAQAGTTVSNWVNVAGMVLSTETSPWSGGNSSNSTSGNSYYPLPQTIGTYRILDSEVTFPLWTEVKTWATNAERGGNVYTFSADASEGNSASSDTTAYNPAATSVWADMAVWLNAWSEKDGKQPVYVTAEGAVIRDAANVLAQHDKSKIAGKNGYRLPTEAEWEFAARGGDPASTVWAYEWPGFNTAGEANDYGWNSGNASSKSHAVKAKLPNTLGLYDMFGNLAEMCYDPYNSTDSTNSTRVTRGGMFLAGSAQGKVVFRLTGAGFASSPERCGFRPVYSVTE